MKKVHLEVFLAILFVAVSTAFVYGRLVDVRIFWNSQTAWSAILMAGWIIVALGYFHQGLLVRSGHSASHVSALLPSAVFIVQCVLFVKGIYYEDWSLIFGAVVVNTGVVFSLYQIFKNSSHPFGHPKS